MNKEREFFLIEVPPVDKLKAFKALIELNEVHDGSAKTNFHWQILKCRQLIFADRNILCSAVSYNHGEIYVIVSQETHDFDHLNALINKFNMKCSPEIPLTLYVYESCLRYSIGARLAPLWNPVGGYLIQGREFLLSRETLNAVKIDIGKIGKDIYIFLWPIRMKLSYVTYKELDIPLKMIDKMETDPKYVIESINSYLYVLPSLKKGQIWSISKNIPPTCPYPTYKALRRHWKNMYGYRLPEIPLEDMFYIQILFKFPKPNLYHYPNLCLNTTELIFYQKVDFQNVYLSFIRDLNKKMPSVCGFINNSETGLAQMKSNQNLSVEESTPIKSYNLIPFQPTIISSVSQYNDIDNNISLMTPENSLNEEERGHKISVFEKNNPFSLPVEAQNNITFTSQINQYQAQRMRGAYGLPPNYSSFQRMVYKPSFYNTPYLNMNTSNNESLSKISISQFSRLNDNLKNENKFEMENFLAHKNNNLLTQPNIGLNFTMPFQNTLTFSNDPNCLKRKDEMDTYEKMMIKKPRSKPQIQVGLDIEQMAKGGDLSKANSATLIDWLKSKSVYCKAKEKKTDLVEKVNQYLGIE